MAKIDLQAKFPNLRPVTKAPGMRLVNGFGTRLVGKRDLDAETKSYLSTLCVCLLFVPVIALKAYRVLPSPRGGWFFLGTEPLSAMAKAWNALLGVAALTVAVTIGLTAYTSRPEYIAQKHMEEARNLAGQGQLAKAAGIYADLVTAGSFQADQAGEALKDIIDTPCEKSQGTEAAGVFAAAARLTMRPRAYAAPDLVEHGLRVAAALGPRNAKGALALLDVVRPLVLDSREIDKARLPLLRQWVAAEPGNMEAVIGLASLLVEMDQHEEAGKLLLPFKDQLGDGEGARVLGTIYVHDGKYEEAYALLMPYVKPRLESLHAAENQANSVEQALWDKEIQALRENKGPPEFYRRLDSATKDQQDAIVREYVSEKLKNHPQILALEAAMEKESGVVPVAMELGMVMLERAQGVADAAERKRQLEATQDIFLSIKGAAGQSDEYRMFLGQVYYWLGQQAEGKKLFDEFLTSKGRSAAAMLRIAETLRMLGVDSEARSMAEEVYGKATQGDERYAAAHLRSLVAKDTDDEIAWLRKSDPDEPMIKVTLATSLGHKAMQEGRDEEAAGQYRAALDICNALPRNRLTLNQISLISDALYRTTGDPKEMARSVDAIQQALALDPSDAVLMYNAGMSVLEASVIDVIGKDLDLQALRTNAGLSTLDFLYKNETERDAMMTRVADHPGIVKATAYFDKVMVVSPKNPRSYAGAYEIASFLHNEAGLKSIEQRLKAADLDTADDLRETREFLDGTNDARNLTSLNAAIRRYEIVATTLRARGGIEGGAGGGASLAVALSYQMAGLMQRDVMDGSTDPEKVVALALEANQASSSSATRSGLAGAYFFRAFKQLRQSNPAFDQFARQYYRALGYMQISAFLVQQQDPLGKELLAHPDFQRGLALLKEDQVFFPATASGIKWALFSVTDPAAAQVQAANLKQPRQVLGQAISSLLSPGSGAEAMDAAWMSLAAGNAAEAKAALARVAGQGIPVPQLK